MGKSTRLDPPKGHALIGTPAAAEPARASHVPVLMQASIDKAKSYAELGRFVALYFNDSAEPGKTNEDILRELAHLEQFRVLLNKAR